MLSAQASTGSQSSTHSSNPVTSATTAVNQSSLAPEPSPPASSVYNHRPLEERVISTPSSYHGHSHHHRHSSSSTITPIRTSQTSTRQHSRDNSVHSIQHSQPVNGNHYHPPSGQHSHRHSHQDSATNSSTTTTTSLPSIATMAQQQPGSTVGNQPAPPHPPPSGPGGVPPPPSSSSTGIQHPAAVAAAAAQAHMQQQHQQQHAHPSAVRFNDLLEFVKAEFDQVAGESGVLKVQREEYEAMINHHANELNAMRAMSYDLERKHHEDKRAMQDENSRLQDEIVHLRHQLANGGGSAPGASQQQQASGAPVPNRPTLPPISSASRPGSSAPPPHSLFGDHGPPPPPPPPAAPGSNPYATAADSLHASKRSRTDDTKPTIPSVSSVSKYPGPPGSNAGGSRPSSVGPNANQQPPRHQQPSPMPQNGGALSAPARRETASPAVNVGDKAGAASGDQQGELFDPETVTRDLKKEGSDWMTMFNPNVKRVLDVGLVHTLVHDSVVCCVRFSPDGKILATGCNRNTTLYDTKTGAKITVLSDDSPSGVKQDNYIRSASFSPDGKLLATGSEDRVVRIWNIAQKRIAKVFQGHKSEIYSLAFSPDGRRLVSGSGDKTARVWDTETGTCVHTLAIDDVTIAENGPVDAGVTSVVISPDGTLLAAGSLDTVVRIWDAHTGVLLDKLKGHKDSVYSVAFAPDGKFLVSGSLDRTLKMWDMGALKANLAAAGASASTTSSTTSQTGGKESPAPGEAGKTPCLTTLQGHKDYVLSVDISPDGAWIVSGSKDRGVQFWDPRSAKAQFMLQGHKNSVISVAVSDVGGLVATGSGDWSARIWHYEKLAN